MLELKNFAVKPLSMVTREGLQRVDINCYATAPAHLRLEVYREDCLVAGAEVALMGGKCAVPVLLPQQPERFDATWILRDRQGWELAGTRAEWTTPRERTMYVMLSSHTDIGLHNSQYIQRLGSVQTLEKVKKLCDETDSRPAEDRYRYTMEGTWFWNNYGQDRGEEAAHALIRDYIRPGKMGVCCGIAGNHFQTFGPEELCRSAGERRRLLEKWGIDSHTMAIIDINGIPMSVIGPYSDAGMENIIFAPNHWNPIPSRVWKMDIRKEGCYLNPDASGGGSRCDVRYESHLPMVFFWEDAQGRRLLVWASTQYGYGGASIGLLPNRPFVPETVPIMEACMGDHLPLLDEKYPYDLWLLCCYDDDQEPNLSVADSIAAWNAKWAWPKLRTLGDPDEPFRILRERYADQIPVLKGDITGGWFQHPLTAAELLAEKFEADRLLPTAEKWSTVAAALDEGYGYPATDFRRAWDHLLFNDEHSYGVSGYQGRRVYETWIQHRDWIMKARATAEAETDRALRAIGSKIPTGEEAVAVFNPTAQPRLEAVELTDGTGAFTEIPAFGYRVLKKRALEPLAPVTACPDSPPVAENGYYRIVFAENGSISSIFDKEEGRELLDLRSPFRAGELVYTKDDHASFHVPGKALFSVTEDRLKTTVTVTSALEELGAELRTTVTLPRHEKRIDLDHKILHAKDMVNSRRYHRYLYMAFPFAVEDCRRYCHLSGAVAEYAVDVTGHGTDVYMAANEWCCAENGRHGTALMMLDSQLMEFDHIHPDKTDFGNTGDSSQMFAYLATDWLQMHLPGGSHLDYRFRFSITSYPGSYEEAGIPRLAERYANPVRTLDIGPQEGPLDRDSHSFLSAGQRLLCLKRSDDGDGIIARLYGKGAAELRTDLPGCDRAERIQIDERAAEGPMKDGGFSTYRLGAGALKLTERPVPEIKGTDGAPAPIGSVYTGLITEPRAAAGEHDGHLYLLWGASMEEDLSHYELFRSEDPGFTAGDATFLAKIAPEEYRVGRYVDEGLKTHTLYHYRVRAVNRAGRPGPLSEVFSAWTREPI